VTSSFFLKSGGAAVTSGNPRSTRPAGNESNYNAALVRSQRKRVESLQRAYMSPGRTAQRRHYRLNQPPRTVRAVDHALEDETPRAEASHYLDRLHVVIEVQDFRISGYVAWHPRRAPGHAVMWMRVTHRGPSQSDLDRTVDVVASRMAGSPRAVDTPGDGGRSHDHAT